MVGQYDYRSGTGEDEVECAILLRRPMQPELGEVDRSYDCVADDAATVGGGLRDVCGHEVEIGWVIRTHVHV